GSGTGTSGGLVRSLGSGLGSISGFTHELSGQRGLRKKRPPSARAVAQGTTSSRAAGTIRPSRRHGLVPSIDSLLVLVRFPFLRPLSIVPASSGIDKKVKAGRRGAPGMFRRHGLDKSLKRYLIKENDPAWRRPGRGEARQTMKR